jgi:hypothetical protein
LIPKLTEASHSPYSINSPEVISKGCEDALLLVVQAIDKIMTADDLQQQDVVISKLLGQDIVKYKSLFPHVSAAIHLSNDTGKHSMKEQSSLILKKGGVNHGVPIIKDNCNKNNVKATQAYKLFSEGKKLVEVSIELDIRENEASKYFHEFLRLKGQYEVYEIYLENKYHIKSLRKLYRVLKREGITTDNIEWFVNMVKLGTYKIPELQNEYAKLKDEIESI